MVFNLLRFAGENGFSVERFNGVIHQRMVFRERRNVIGYVTILATKTITRHNATRKNLNAIILSKILA